MDTMQIERTLTELIDGHWADKLKKSKSAYLQIDWSDPANVDAVIHIVEGEIEWKMSRIDTLRLVLRELYDTRQEMATDGGVFFHELVPIQAWGLFSEEETEAFGDCSMPTSREIVEKVGEVLPDIVKGAIIDILSKCMED